MKYKVTIQTDQDLTPEQVNQLANAAAKAHSSTFGDRGESTIVYDGSTSGQEIFNDLSRRGR